MATCLNSIVQSRYTKGFTCRVEITEKVYKFAASRPLEACNTCFTVLSCDVHFTECDTRTRKTKTRAEYSFLALCCRKRCALSWMLYIKMV